MANAFVVGVVGLVIGVIMVINVLIPILKGTNTTALKFTSAETSLYNVISIGAFVGLVVASFAIFGLV